MNKKIWFVLVDILSYDSYRAGFLAILDQFNGLEELVKREDRLPVLLEVCQDLKASMPESQSMNESEAFLRWKVLEIMLAQPEITEDSKN